MTRSRRWIEFFFFIKETNDDNDSPIIALLSLVLDFYSLSRTPTPAPAPAPLVVDTTLSVDFSQLRQTGEVTVMYTSAEPVISLRFSLQDEYGNVIPLAATSTNSGVLHTLGFFVSVGIEDGFVDAFATTELLPPTFSAPGTERAAIDRSNHCLVDLSSLLFLPLQPKP